MKENKGKTEYVNTAQRFYELLLSGQHKVTSFDLFSDEVMAVEYKSEEDFVEVNASTNVVIAAYVFSHICVDFFLHLLHRFTTCLARLHLYQFMEKLGLQLLYCDTDSVIFSWKPG